ncbi:AI-2E family transporter [Sabulicella rubraurantiaca]|uniref:AI-2E family transporter n=1 Tax=Sabulicella rubraurantiaca TaxID=2811429 RepID=UPI001A97AC7A|nr:AI-2E family transporter [Sabulicella rubraurantiaca]
MAPFQTHFTVPSRTDLAQRLLIVAGVVAVLWLGRDILAPLALALLLTIAALPIGNWLEKHGVPRVVAVLAVMLLLLGLISGVLWTVVSQALTLAGELPSYETTVREKLVALTQTSGPIQGVMALFERLSAALAPPSESPAATVAVAAGASSPFATMLGALHMVMAPVATVLITLLLMAFLLVYREDLRDRVLRLAGTHDLHRTTNAMLDATDRVGRFLLMQVMMNAVFGASMGIGLWMLGLPNAPLWGALCFTLRFIPYLGAPLSVLFPIILAFATTEGWWAVFGVVGLFLIVDGLVTYVLEPWLYGHSIGVTPIALVLAAGFWAVLWGPLGLILAPALTACIVIVGRHVPGFRFLDVLLGDSPPLEPQARFYQRLLAGDADGAGMVFDRHASSENLGDALNRFVFPAIAQVESDRRHEGFGPALALRASRTLLRVLEERGEEAADPHIVVRPMAGALDHAAAAAVGLALVEEGHCVTLEPRRADLAVLVMASGAGRPRLWRALRAARQLAPRAILFAVTDEAEQAVSSASLGPWLTELPRLLEEARPFLPAEDSEEDESQPKAEAAQ